MLFLHIFYVMFFLLQA